MNRPAASAAAAPDAPGARAAADAGTDPADQPPSRRLQLATVCLGLALLVFWQSAGQVAADTKLDLVVAPLRFLSNALRMWDPLNDGGTLQNQAYGYLFPMGPFFVLGHAMHLPAWIVQRAWESLLVVAAFLGTVRLSGVLGIRRFWPRVAAGLAYALAPRMLSELGAISSELMPFAAAPWVLIPLVRGSRARSPRRAAMRSGVALLFAGGVNAAATVAILPLPALWLLTRERGPRRASLTRWWVLATGLACLWWAVPLAVLGKYAPPFLNYIESSAVTTQQTSLATSLRGAEHWIGYLGPGIWPAAWSLVSSTPVVLGTALVAAAGIAGINRARARDKLFLALSITLGLVLITLGHADPVHPLAASSWRHALDGSLDAFRNVHKFDPVVRLPLAIGVGWAVAGVADRLRIPRARRLRLGAVTAERAFAIAAVSCALGLSVSPAFANQLMATTRDTVDPAWWSQTADWLADHSDGGRALIVPAANTPYYLWGSPSDDALQPYARSPWTVRDSVPLAQPGYIRLLDQIDAILAGGRGDPTLAPLLARSGIRYVVVRQDLDIATSGSTPLPFVDTTLNDSPGLTLVNRFGPNLHAGAPNDLIDQNATLPGTVLIWQDSDWQGPAGLDPVASTVVANGSADNLPQLLASGVQPDQAVVFGSAGAGLTGLGATYRFLDDGTRRREAAYGSTQVYSGTMFAGQPYRLDRPNHDYLPSPPPPLSAYRTTGVRSVTASSSGTDVDAVINRAPTDGPWSAIDGDPRTAWRSGAITGLVGQWLQVTLDRPLASPAATIATTGVGDDLPSRIEVSTSSGTVTDALDSTRQTQPLQLPAGPARWVRLTVVRTADGRPGYGAGIAALAIGGVHAARTLAVPSSGTPDDVRFDVEAGSRSSCLTVDGTAACDPVWANAGEETDLDRTFTTAARRTFRIRAQVRLRGGAALDRLLAAGNPLAAVASSTDSADPREQAGAAVDGDPRTGWVAKPGDRRPVLAIRTVRRLVTGVRLTPISGAAVSSPHKVTVSAGAVRITTTLPGDGVISLPRPVRTSSLAVTVDVSAVRSSMSSITGVTRLLPVGIGEVSLLGPRGSSTGRARATLTVPCGGGPAITVDGKDLPTALTASRSAALGGQPVSLQVCGSAAVRIAAGQHRVVLQPNALTTPVSLSLTAKSLPTAPPAGRLSVASWGSTNRSVRVATTAPSLLVVPENSNAGWQATLHGERLPSVMVDGWEQAWILPAGATGTVSLRFAPQTTVAGGLIAGGVAAVVLVVFAIRPPRRRPLLAPAEPGRIGERATAVVALAAGVLLGSLPGLAVAAAVVGLEWLVRRHDRRLLIGPTWLPGGWRSLAAAAGLSGVAVAIALRPFSDVGSHAPLAGSGVIQLVCIAVVALTLLSSSADSGLGRGTAAPQAGQRETTRRRGRGRRGAGPPRV